MMKKYLKNVQIIDTNRMQLVLKIFFILHKIVNY